MVGVTLTASAVTASGIYLTTSELTFYNFSQSDYDVSDHYITVGTTEYAVNNLSISYGSLTVSPGDSVRFSGFSFKTSAVTANSVALWAPGTFPGTPGPSDMVDFVQYGDTGQPFEDLAIQSFRWTVGDYITGEPDYVRTSFNFTGSDEWTALNNVSTGIVNILDNANVDISPNPFNQEITVELNGLAEFVTECQLIDYSGKVINSVQGIRENKIKLETDAGLPAGIYLVRILGMDGSATTRKILKL